jgi:predicted transposase/invertase (TIGR01784 family)
MEKRFYPPSFDFIFKLVFGDQRNIKILTAFLIAALNLPEEEFDHLAIIDPHLKREFWDDKMSILDVKVHTKHGVIINVEMQVETSQDLRKRIAFATAKMLAEQIKRGDEYRRVERVASIVICGGVVLSEVAGYYNTYSIRNAQSGAEFTDVLAINILEPGKLPPGPDEGRLYDWGRFFRAKTAEELAMAGERDPAIREATAVVMELNEDERAQLLAEARWKWKMDHAALERQHYRNGLTEGQQQGLQQAEAKYQPVVEGLTRENQAIKQEIEKKELENEALRRKLREAGIEA